jgi:hypothetical protein
MAQRWRVESSWYRSLKAASIIEGADEETAITRAWALRGENAVLRGDDEPVDIVACEVVPEPLLDRREAYRRVSELIRIASRGE